MNEARSLASVAGASPPELTKYELYEELGHGGMATVYRAHDRRLGREVAIKVIHRHLREHAEVAARFTSEARAVAKLRHPSIVEVFDVSDESEPERYLVVELVRGPTLRRLLAERGHLPPEIAAALVLELAGALGQAHAHGVIHRDVKPENVLLDLDQPRHERQSERPVHRRSRVKLTDFGIAKLLDAQGVTSTGQVLGSPAHMSPEQIEGGAVDERSDVFGLGVLFYECLVGTLPFDGKNPAQVLRRVLDGTFTAAERARPTVGWAFGRIAARALGRAPEDRYATMADFAADLSAELEAMGFVEPREELEAYLVASESYLPRHLDRVVARLVERGRAARLERSVPLAAACFNRALAYRPDDHELLRLVSGLAKTERWRRTVRRLAVGAGGIVLLAGGGSLGFRWLLAREGPVGQASSVARVAAVSPAPPASLAPRPSGVAPTPEDAPPKSVRRSARQGASGATATPIKSTPRALGRRPVKVVISGGAIGGYVIVDGARLSSGESRELEIGRRYDFEFRPPDDNADCCAITTRQVEVGESTELVEASVPFHPATILASRAPPGTTIDCGMIGKGSVPHAMRVTFNNEPLIQVTCSLVPPVASGVGPRESSVTLTPGLAVDLWP